MSSTVPPEPRERGGWLMPDGIEELIAAAQEVLDGKRPVTITIGEMKIKIEVGK